MNLKYYQADCSTENILRRSHKQRRGLETPLDQPPVPDGGVGALLHINLAFKHLTALRLLACGRMRKRKRFDKCERCYVRLTRNQNLHDC